MEYVPPINGNLADPDRSYVNANPGASVEGSIPAAEAIEHPLREIVNVIEEAGLTPDGGDLTQLHAAIVAIITANAPTSVVNRGVEGMTIANNGSDATNDLDIGTGSALADDFSTTITLAAGLTKRLDATFTAGNNGGGLDTGTKANSTTYHIFAIKNPTTSAVDVLFSASLSPTMPSGFTKKRRIGSIRTTSGGAWQTFAQRNNQFLLVSPAIDINATQGTTAALYSVPSPAGIKTEIILSLSAQNGNNNFITVTDPDFNITGIPSVTAPPHPTFGDGLSTTAPGGTERVFTNTSSQVRINAAAASTALKGSLLGWIDDRRI